MAENIQSYIAITISFNNLEGQSLSCAHKRIDLTIKYKSMESPS